ncbi:MAG TPA: DUF4265 domain-containing protein [Telluria sp.]|jgi:hypothetical protein
MEKVAFALNVVDGWPPVATEHVWCEKTDGIFRLKNSPFFIKGLACGDWFSAEPDAVNGCVFAFTLLESSGHSLVWISDHAGPDLDQYQHELFALGLGIEYLPQFKHYAIDVPASAERRAVNALMDRLEKLGFAMAFPVWHH